MSDEELIKETMMLDYSQLIMHNVYMIKENKRLNNIINELEKWLEERSEFTNFGEVLDKLQELKGDNNDG